MNSNNYTNSDKNDIRFDKKGVNREIFTKRIENMLPNIMSSITENISDSVNIQQEKIKQENKIRARLNLKPI